MFKRKKVVFEGLGLTTELSWNQTYEFHGIQAFPESLLESLESRYRGVNAKSIEFDSTAPGIVYKPKNFFQTSIHTAINGGLSVTEYSEKYYSTLGGLEAVALCMFKKNDELKQHLSKKLGNKEIDFSKEYSPNQIFSIYKTIGSIIALKEHNHNIPLQLQNTVEELQPLRSLKVFLLDKPK
jgi:hypothetical protein